MSEQLKPTPGPWRWELNQKNKMLHLVGGKPQYDLTIIEPTRWGMGSATLMIRDTAHDGMNLLHKLHERPDWIRPFPGRDHHKEWCAAVKHPDMQLIEAAPKMLEALRRAVVLLAAVTVHAPELNGFEEYQIVSDAIAEATGAPRSTE